MKRTTRNGTALGLLGLALAGPHTAHAQAPVVLSLTPLAATAAVGSTVTFTVNLTGGTSIAAYNINVLVDPAQFQFVNTGTAASPNYFTVTDTDFISLPTQLSATGGDMNFGGADFNGVNNVGPTGLGTFQLKVLSALPLAGGTISYGPSGTAGGFGGTSVMDPNGNNELTQTTGATLFTPAPTPEPSQTAALGLGVLGLAGLVLKARRRQSA